MYINEREFGKKNFETVKKVAQHFNNVGASCPSSAAEMDVSGSSMMSLVRLGAAKVVGKRESFVCVDEERQLYRRYETNLYVLTITASDFWKRYVQGVEYICNENKQQAEVYVSAAKQKLNEVECLLDKVERIRI
jgi:hypothetical protein